MLDVYVHVSGAEYKHWGKDFSKKYLLGQKVRK